MHNRRQWLKTALAVSAGAPIISSLSQQLMAAPVSNVEKLLINTQNPQIRVRLNSNENPYGPSEKARKAVIESLSEANRYPFDILQNFKQMLATKEGVSPECIAIGAGSGDMLCVTALAFGIEGGSFLSAFPTFPMLMSYGEVFNARWDKVNLNDKLEHNFEAMASAIKKDTKLVFVCNPNNPTGTLVDSNVLKSFCDNVSKKVPVFVDEAYIEFLEPSQQVSMVEMVRENKNIIVSRTFSKIYGLAGLRLGYVVGHPELIKKITNYTNGIPLSQTGIAAAKACLGDNEFVELSRAKNAQARKVLTDYLDSKGIFYGNSHTNFVFFDPKKDARNIMEKLNQRGIGIRVWDYLGKQWCRVSIGTIEEMRLFVPVYDQIAST